MDSFFGGISKESECFLNEYRSSIILNENFWDKTFHCYVKFSKIQKEFARCPHPNSNKCLEEGRIFQLNTEEFDCIKSQARSSKIGDVFFIKENDEGGSFDFRKQSSSEDELCIMNILAIIRLDCVERGCILESRIQETKLSSFYEER